MNAAWWTRQRRQGMFWGALGMLTLVTTAALGYALGRQANPRSQPLDLSLVSTAATGTNMAVATGQISEEAEGVFFLDFLTGDLQCLVYYPRLGAFGARYYTNIQAQIPGGGKAGQYLMVTGNAISARASSNLKPANCLVYVTDVTSGLFAAYAVPWNRSAESSSQAQGGPLLFVGGGPIRNYQVADPARKPGANAGGVGGNGPAGAMPAPPDVKNKPDAKNKPGADPAKDAGAGQADANPAGNPPAAKDRAGKDRAGKDRAAGGRQPD